MSEFPCKQWLLFLEGGGWCYGMTANETIASCSGRAKLESEGTADYGGVLSSDPAV